MRIGIDIDGVLNNVERFQLDVGAKFGASFGKSRVVRPDAIELEQIFDWTKEQDNLFWNQYNLEWFKHCPIREFASEVLSKLKQQGHEIYIITARNTDSLNISKEKLEEIIDNWLAEKNVAYDKLIIAQHGKEKECSQYNIDVLVDDDPYNIERVSKITNVFCFDTPYNKQCIGPNIQRVYSFYDLLAALEEIK